MNDIIFYFARPIYRYFKLAWFQVKWRKANKHNHTGVGTVFPIEIVNIGRNTYGTINAYYFPEVDGHLKIGNYCSIAGNVKFLLGGEHPIKTISTFPFNAYVYKENSITNKKDCCNTIVDDDVWIGSDAIILSNVHIGQGAIIGAGSVVAKDIPPYAIYAGGRIIKYRFSQNVIEKLSKLSYKNINYDKLKTHYRTEINDENIDKILEEITNE